MMRSLAKGVMVMALMSVIAGCHQSRGVDNGRPVAPASQAVPGGPTGQGPVGQPEAK